MFAVIATNIPASLAAHDRLYRDRFAVPGDYSSSDGTDAWNGPWVEDDDGDPTQGAVRVASSGGCVTDACLRLGQMGVATASMWRSFDAVGALDVTLGFSYRRSGTGTGRIAVEAGAAGGPWVEVGAILLNGDDTTPQSAVYDLSAFAHVDTAVRFVVVGGADGATVEIDDLIVTASYNAAPAFVDPPGDRSDAEGANVRIEAVAIDPEGSGVVYTLGGQPHAVGIDPDTGVIGGVLDYTAAGTYSTVVTATDPAGAATSVTFDWTVVDTDRAPWAHDRTVAAIEDDVAGVVVDLLDPEWTADPDMDTLVVEAIDTSPSTGSVTDHHDGKVTYRPAPDFDGVDTFGFTVGDGRGQGASATVTVTVAGTADAPRLRPVPAVTVVEETPVAFTAEASDPDRDDAVAFSLAGGPEPVPAGAVIDAATGEFSWLPTEADGPAQHRFLVVATDTTNRSDVVPVSIDVKEANRAPILGTVADQALTEGTAVSLLVPVTELDVPAGTLTFAASGLPTGLTIDPDTGVVSGRVSTGASERSPYGVLVSAHDDAEPPLGDLTAFIIVVRPPHRATPPRPAPPPPSPYVAPHHPPPVPGPPTQSPRPPAPRGLVLALDVRSPFRPDPQAGSDAWPRAIVAATAAIRAGLGHALVLGLATAGMAMVGFDEPGGTRTVFRRGHARPPDR
jgi:hypothetical protein